MRYLFATHAVVLAAGMATHALLVGVLHAGNWASIVPAVAAAAGYVISDVVRSRRSRTVCGAACGLAENPCIRPPGHRGVCSWIREEDDPLARLCTKCGARIGHHIIQGHDLRCPDQTVLCP